MSKLRKTFLMALIFVLWNMVWAAPVAAQQSDQVVFGRLKTYVHEDNLFAIDYPANWQKTDLSDPDSNVAVATVSFNDESALGTFMVQVMNPGMRTFDSNAFNGFFKAWVENQKKMFDKYSAGTPRQLSDDRWSMSFKFERAGTLKSLPMKMKGDVYAQWHGEYLSVVVVMLPVSQYAKNQKTLTAMVNSFEMNPDRASNETQALAEYEHFDGAFRIEYPEDWKAEDVSEDARIAALFWQPKGQAYIRLDVMSWKGKASMSQITELLETNTEEIFGEKNEYEAGEVTRIDQDSVQRVFSFETEDRDGKTVLMIGLMMVRRYDGMNGYLQIVMPEDMIRSGRGAKTMQNILDSLQLDVDVAGEYLK